MTDVVSFPHTQPRMTSWEFPLSSFVKQHARYRYGYVGLEQ